MDSTVVTLFDSMTPIVALVTGSDKLAVLVCSVVAGVVSGLIRAAQKGGSNEK